MMKSAFLLLLFLFSNAAQASDSSVDLYTTLPVGARFSHVRGVMQDEDYRYIGPGASNLDVGGIADDQALENDGVNGPAMYELKAQVQPVDDHSRILKGIFEVVGVSAAGLDVKYVKDIVGNYNQAESLIDIDTPMRFVCTVSEMMPNDWIHVKPGGFVKPCTIDDLHRIISIRGSSTF